MKIPFIGALTFPCEECGAKGKKLAAISLLAGVAIGAGVIFLVKRK